MWSRFKLFIRQLLGRDVPPPSYEIRDGILYFSWQVPDFRGWSRSEETIRTEGAMVDHHGVQWELHLQPRRMRTSDQKEFVSVQLHLVSNPHEEIHMRANVGILSADGTTSRQYASDWLRDRHLIEMPYLAALEDVLDPQRNMLQEGSLVLVGEIQVIDTWDTQESVGQKRAEEEEEMGNVRDSFFWDVL